MKQKRIFSKLATISQKSYFAEGNFLKTALASLAIIKSNYRTTRAQIAIIRATSCAMMLNTVAVSAVRENMQTDREHDRKRNAGMYRLR